MYNNLGSVTHVNDNKYAKHGGNSVKGMETLGLDCKDGENIKDKLADLSTYVSSVEALGEGNTVVLVCCGYYVALTNVLMVEDL